MSGPHYFERATSIYRPVYFKVSFFAKLLSSGLHERVLVRKKWRFFFLILGEMMTSIKNNN